MQFSRSESQIGLSKSSELLLLTATRDLERSGAAVLKAVLDGK